MFLPTEIHQRPSARGFVMACSHRHPPRAPAKSQPFRKQAANTTLFPQSSHSETHSPVRESSIIVRNRIPAKFQRPAKGQPCKKVFLRIARPALQLSSVPLIPMRLECAHARITCVNQKHPRQTRTWVIRTSDYKAACETLSCLNTAWISLWAIFKIML